jgi:sugar phosphate isomerase/epimerase
MTTSTIRAARPRVLASTTSHKREPLLPTLEVFARLGLADVDLNLHHILEGGVPVADVHDAVARLGLRLWVLSGGWCDFYHRPPEIDRTFASVARQVQLADALGVSHIRLFFGRLQAEDYSRAAFETVSRNIAHIADAHPHVTFAFENHDGASLRPEVCREILDAVARPTIAMNFDPINFAKAGVDPAKALDICRPVVGHVHLKGLAAGHYCEYGEGDVDLEPVIGALETSGYAGGYTVEYEGPFDGTLRLFRSTERARQRLER